ncbi:hypothetical protein EDB92DRAFT_307367 [Lactarius akahatsu]|uniref:Uncharacterized protein n=1 Tax=Lactarius akahatsu TaxID=416441 RepID=A0AAD4L6I2_9AGAM|nr:hypothetical protein EDB92DRAFT_307367 [Lactarius akahatsu]
MGPENVPVFRRRGMTLLFRTFYLIIQSIFYGIYATLIPISTYIMVKKGLHSLSQKILFGVIVFMFSLSTAYLAVSIVDLITLIKTWYLVLDVPDSIGTTRPTGDLMDLFNALAVINYALTDGVVVWRAWIICRDESRKLLIAPIVMLMLTMLGVAAIICVRETTLISSLVTNILSTGVVSLKAWRYRRWIVEDLQRVMNKRTKAERVLALLVESGVFYMFSGAMLVASSLIRTPGSHFVLGTLYLQAAVHLAGIYPVIIVIVVNQEASMDKTLFNSTLPVIVTDLQQASKFRAGQTTARQARSMIGASLQFTPAQGPHPSRSSLAPSSPQDSLASSSSPKPDADCQGEIRVKIGDSVE